MRMPEEDVVSPLTELIVGAYGIEGLEFTKIDYPTFRAEYAWKDDDLIYHFFRPENVTDRVWIAEFPIHLDAAARAFFRAELPRLRAAYSDEMDSWWLRACDYLLGVDPVAFPVRFLDKMDHALRTRTLT
jgi:hypothetical protein